MRASGPTSRFLLIAAVALFTASTAVAVTVYRRLQATRAEAQMYIDTSPFVMSANKTRDADFTFVVENYGFQYRGTTGNMIDDSVLLFGAWEKHILFFIEDYAKATGTQDTAFVDVGANTGQYTLFMASRAKEVHAVEPYPPVIRKLHANVALSKFTNVTVHELGLGVKEGVMPFLAPVGTNHGIGTFHEDPALKGQLKPGGNIRIAAGDDILKNVARIGSMKIDIEGFEESALKGLRQTLEKHRPMMVLEVSAPPGGTIASFDHLKSLFPANYTFFVLPENDHNTKFLTGRYEVDDFAPVAAGYFKNGGHWNVVAVADENAAKTPRRKP